MITLNEHLKNTFNTKVYKLSLNAGMTCPNRDGTLDMRGCIFCSSGGSGEFAASPSLSITEQIEQAKLRVAKKLPKCASGVKYIAYFQAYTNTYAPVEKLEKYFSEAITHPDIVALSIATRPDCLPPDVLKLLSKLNKIKPVWMELGLQTIHPSTTDYIRRGYDLECFNTAVRNLAAINVEVIVHVILGLPFETEDMILATVRYVATLDGVKGIKLQLLHVLAGTDLALDYEKGIFRTLEFDEYVELAVKCLKILPPDMVVHRLTGDGAKSLLIAPLWSADKRPVLQAIERGIK